MPRNPVFAAADKENQLLALYWRRTKKGREGVRWHRGGRMPVFGVIFGLCGAESRSDGNRIEFVLAEDGEWPEPHCRTCEERRPGTDAVRAAVYLGVTDPYTAVLGPVRPRRSRA